MSYIEDNKRFQSRAKCRVKCKCSHTLIMASADRAICSHCGNWVYRTPKIKFMYEMKDKLRKVENNDKTSIFI